MPIEIGKIIINLYLIEKFTIKEIQYKTLLSYYLISKFLKENNIKIYHARKRKNK